MNTPSFIDFQIAGDTLALLVIGVSVLAASLLGKLLKRLKVPSIIGYMLTGVILGPSLVGLFNHGVIRSVSFITDMALGFVAVSIGIELNFKAIRKLGKGLPTIILSEAFGAFVVVFGIVWLVTRDLPTALIFGAIAPPSAPAGTVAVIQEERAKGPLTSAMYAVVGLDDGIGVIIFGFAAALAKSMMGDAGAELGFLASVIGPLKEIGIGVGIGLLIGLPFSILLSRLKGERDVFPLTFSMVLIIIGLSKGLHASPILANLTAGIIIANVQPQRVAARTGGSMAGVMPLVFIIFFTLAGTNLHIAALPALGVIGALYIVGRSGGKLLGVWFGATIGKAAPVMRKYLGIGILSQAGVAIGLALTVRQDFMALGPAGEALGAAVITTVTATSVVFEIIGPILTRVSLKKANEIQKG